MNEKEFGQAFFSISETMKDALRNNLMITCRQVNISPEVMDKIIMTALSSVEQVATNSFPSLFRSISTRR